MALPIFPYQAEGADYMAGRIRAGLFDEPGVGKTCQAIRACDKRAARRIVVICPAAVREHWRGEFAKFGMIQRRVVKGVSVHDLNAWAKGIFDVLVVSFELATKWAPRFHEACDVIDAVIIDEGHYLKEGDTKRAKAILGPEADGFDGILQWACAAWWLTGTPIPNDPLDIFTFLKFTGCMPLNKGAFCKRYFHSRPRTYSSVQTPKTDMLPELQALIANNSLRRSLAETGVQLPPIFLTTTLVDGDTQHVRDLLLQHPGLDRAIMDALKGEGGGLSKLDADHIATLRRLIGEAKAVPYGAMLLGELHGGLDKVVVFGIHRVALTTLRAYLGEHGIQAVLINGDTPEKHREIYIKQFQEDPQCRVFIGNIRAAGVGLTLTAAAALDVLEADWTPAGNAQALKRIHRIGQVRNVRARFVTLARSFDEVVNEILAEKTATIAAIEQTNA
jgi:SWI/SNF-related matrix-associated actin-dependent regulator of chromatin subfamily A-like protein 1